MHDGGRKKKIHYFTLCKASRIGTFDEVLHDVISFLTHTQKKQNKTKKQNKPLRLCRTLMSRNACNGETGEKSPSAGDLNWMPKVAPWRLAILAKMAILAKFHAYNGETGENCQPLAI